MCGRMILTAGSVELANHFGLDAAPVVAPRYNIAPSQLVAVVAPKGEKRGLAFLKWGLVPYWSNDGKGGHINARAETVE
jgi:putative SOS response-associated peptidase YedK